MASEGKLDVTKLDTLSKTVQDKVNVPITITCILLVIVDMWMGESVLFHDQILH